MSGFVRLQVVRRSIQPSFNERLGLHPQDIRVDTRTTGQSKEAKFHQIRFQIWKLRAPSSHRFEILAGHFEFGLNDHDIDLYRT